MGLLLKIALVGVAIYAAWKTFHRWKGLFDRFVGNPVESKREEPPAAPRNPEQTPAGTRKRVVVEETVQCAGCGAYISSGAEKCGHCGRPLP